MKSKLLYAILLLSLFTGIFCTIELTKETEYIPKIDSEFVEYIEKLECSYKSYPEEENNIAADSYLITDNCEYYITYADIITDTKTKEYVNTLKEEIEKNSKEITEIKKDDFYHYSSLGDKYQVVSQIGGTVIYASVDKENQKVIDNFLEALGYSCKLDYTYITLLIISILVFIISLISIIVITLKSKRVTQ